MRSHGSTTARAVTFFRALTEVDPLAERLLNRSLRRKLAFWRWMARRGLSLDRLLLRFASAIGVRSRFFDRCLEAAAEDGLTQVVLVGAGFDTRSLRLPALASMTVYRIDHPATAAARADAMLAAGLTDQGVPIGLDLRDGDLAAALGDAGFDARCPSVFVWEGVSMYLTEAQVRTTLDRMNLAAALGSRLLVDSWHSRWTGWRRRWEGVGHAILRWAKEPIRFGPTPEAFKALVADVGWQVRQHHCTDAVPDSPPAANPLDVFELERVGPLTAQGAGGLEHGPAGAQQSGPAPSY